MISLIAIAASYFGNELHHCSIKQMSKYIFCESPLALGTLVLPNSSVLDLHIAIPYYLVATWMKTIAD